MPVKIPIYQQQVSPQLTPQPRAQGVNYTGAVGAELQAIGREGQIIAQSIQKAQREADLTDRIGRASAELAELELSFDRDPDFRTAPDRFKKSAQDIGQKYLKDVKDPVLSQAFTNQYSKLSQAKWINVRKGSATKEKDYHVASLDTSLDVYATQAANARNPVERELVLNQARLSIATLQTNRWITDVDAGNRERKFLSQIDNATVLRDMTANPSATADRLATDPAYAMNLDPVARERYTDQSFRRADSEQRRIEAEAERARQKRGDEIMKDAWEKLEKGTLTRDFVGNARAFVSPGEYHSLIRGLKEKSEGAKSKNDDSALADLHRILYIDNDPVAAEQQAFKYQKAGLLKSTTLGTFIGTARAHSRQEGPRTEYERSRQYITTSLDPGQFSQDPAPKARMGLAMRELDDFAAAGKRTDKEIREKADDVVKRFSLIDMNALATKTGLGARNDPQQIIENVTTKARQYQRDFENKRMTQAEFNKKMNELNETRKAAEKNLGR